MGRSLGVGVVLLLAALLFIPTRAEAQTSGGERPKPRLEQNYPNPFNPETRIPLVLPDWMFEGGKPVTVSMRILNMATQLVAIPMALKHTEGNVRVNDLQYWTPGRHEAHWDGKDRNGNEVGSAVYLLEVFVNGERLPVRKLIVTK